MPRTVRVLLVGIVLGVCAAVYVYSPSTAASVSQRRGEQPCRGHDLLVPGAYSIGSWIFFHRGTRDDVCSGKPLRSGERGHRRRGVPLQGIV